MQAEPHEERGARVSNFETPVTLVVSATSRDEEKRRLARMRSNETFDRIDDTLRCKHWERASQTMRRASLSLSLRLLGMRRRDGWLACDRTKRSIASMIPRAANTGSAERASRIMRRLSLERNVRSHLFAALQTPSRK